MTKTKPTFRWESEIRETGFELVAGVDEVGRGALAGPVVAASVVLPDDPADDLLELINDSKVLSRRQRERAFEAITQSARSVGVGYSPSNQVDDLGISNATKSAMRSAIAQANVAPDFVIVDAVKDVGIEVPYISIIRGDSQSFSVAAASIVAKVSRDRMMSSRCESDYPEYGFARHKGYGTAHHLRALTDNGPCPIHRMTFRPVAQVLADLNWTAVGAQHASSVSSTFRYALPPGVGSTGETVAARRLQELGYEIVGRNQRTGAGEIDIVALDRGQAVFVEVKTRQRTWDDALSTMNCAPVECVTQRKIQRVMQCAEAYVADAGQNRWPDWRIDFVGVELGADGRALDIEVIRDVELG